jgi:hypothetical protein
MSVRTLVTRLDRAADVLLTGPAIRAVTDSSRVTQLCSRKGLTNGPGNAGRSSRIALSTTVAPQALAGRAAALTNDARELQAVVREYLADARAAADAGRRNRAVALTRSSLERFQTDWDHVLKEVLP